MTKLEAVYEFVMDCMSEMLAGDFIDYLQGAEWIQYVPNGDVAASMAHRKEIEVVFGGDIYIVTIHKARRQA